MFYWISGWRQKIKVQIRAYGDQVFTSLWGLNMPGDGIECKSFATISIDYLLAYENKYYQQVYLNN